MGLESLVMSYESARVLEVFLRLHCSRTVPVPEAAQNSRLITQDSRLKTPMFLSLHPATLVLTIHVIAACIWIGGQITLGMLVPVLRSRPEVVRAAARRFQWLAWVAFLVLIVTGIANIHYAGISLGHLNHNPAGATLTLKLGFVLLSGLAAAIHAFVVGP